MDSVDEIKERLAELEDEVLHKENEAMETDKGRKNQIETDERMETERIRERCELEILRGRRNAMKEINLREVIRSGIGNVNIGDLMLARSANGETVKQHRIILTFLSIYFNL